jgi:hypothetical protein
MSTSKSIIDRNKSWKEKLGWNYGDLMRAFGISHQIDVDTEEFVKLVKEYQTRKGLKADGVLGPATYGLILETSLSPKDIASKKVVDMTISHESGGSYSAMNLDGEFKGQFDKVWLERHGRKHPASGKIHIGLSFGSIQFTQDGGSLGLLLSESAKRNPDKFKQIFGPGWSELIDVTTRKGKSGLQSGSLRGPRVQKVQVPVGNELVRMDLWETPWVERFRRFGNDPEFQAVQRELAIKEYLVPSLSRLKQLNMMSEKSVAAAFDGSVHRGVGGFRTFLNKIVGELKNPTEQMILDKLSSVNNRFEKIIKSPNLSMQKWAGWELYNG